MCKGGSYQEYGPDVLVTQPNWGGGGGGGHWLQFYNLWIPTVCIIIIVMFYSLSVPIEMVRLQLRLQLHC